MLNMDLSFLIGAMNDETRQALENAAESCMGRGSPEIGVEDFLGKLAEYQTFRDIATQFDVNMDEILKALTPKANYRAASEQPVFSQLLIELFQTSYLLDQAELKRGTLDTFTFILTLLKNPLRYSVLKFYKELGKIHPEALQRLMDGLDEGAGFAQPGSEGSSACQGAAPQNAGGFLAKYTIDFIEEAKAGKMDPVFARGPQIRQMVDILSRRRKNNPILVGDPGVGKTSVVEGLALQIVQGNVPEVLLNARVYGLDMGRLQAGSGVKGEFEKRLKGVIAEIKASPTPAILFIDEAHTLVGSGNEAGSGDGANLLKPALSRGELRTIAATTWSEYKKYFEKDAALARRFQLVKLDQPTAAETLTILRGIVPYYEATHKVYIRDDAVSSIAELSTRYISGRQQPDKAIDVLDTACARVKVSLGAKPRGLESLEERLAVAERERDALLRDINRGITDSVAGEDEKRIDALQIQITELKHSIAETAARWENEKQLVHAIIALRLQCNVCSPAPSEPNQDQPEQPDANAVNALQTSPEETKQRSQDDIMAELRRLSKELQLVQGEEPLVFYEVTPQLVAGIVAEWTGIPLGKLNSDAAAQLATLGQKLHARIKGQDFALATLEKAVLASRTGMNNPNAPTAIFLLVGPSGVGKTETALAVADELYGGESMLISINMSEFQEKHTISRLIGSPPGYVGYGEGGRLTEAVRRQPYSVVLFDEVEKAHPDVINLFYQIFDKGVLADGEGRDIDFKNTMIFLTSNLGSDIVAALCENDITPEPMVLQEALRPALTQFFKPALLGRMTIVPYASISTSIMKELVLLKLNRVAERLTHRHHMALTWDENVVSSIAAGCTAVETGARNIDHIINATLLPGISTRLLALMGDKPSARALHISLNSQDGQFQYALEHKG